MLASLTVKVNFHNHTRDEITCSEYSTPLAPYDFAIASIFSFILRSTGYRNFNGCVTFSQAF